MLAHHNRKCPTVAHLNISSLCKTATAWTSVDVEQAQNRGTVTALTKKYWSAQSISFHWQVPTCLLTTINFRKEAMCLLQPLAKP